MIELRILVSSRDLILGIKNATILVKLNLTFSVSTKYKKNNNSNAHGKVRYYV